MLLYVLFASIVCISDIIAASPVSPLKVEVTHERCLNSSSDRSCWGDYNLQTNYYDITPNTGIVREYTWEITNTTGAPDGVERELLLINGQFPGPTIYANWGDTVVVHVINLLENNGTSIHWHGIRQSYTNWNDGVTSITQCPIAPGNSLTYEWRVSQYGTTWYHSHFGLQAWDGIFGAIVLNGPASADHDEDLGPLFLNDWSHDTSEQQGVIASMFGPPPHQNGLINGTNVWKTGGSRYERTLETGKRYLFRVINASASTFFRLSIDNHTMEVVTTDLVAIKPYSTTNLGIAIGQRYNIIVTASEESGDFWLRAVPQQPCSNNESADNIRGIIRYNSTSTDEPTTLGYALRDACEDEVSEKLVPSLAIPASSNYAVEEDYEVSLAIKDGFGYWNLAPTSFLSHWDYPSVLHVAEGNKTWTDAESAVILPHANQWVYFVIETSINQSHPIHLHGHDFWILAKGRGAYSQSNATLQLADGPRRDVATLPAEGFLLNAFYTDNPGAWIMHCHIAFHAVRGLALQLIERPSEMGFNDISTVTETCKDWKEYVIRSKVVQNDDGI